LGLLLGVLFGDLTGVVGVPIGELKNIPPIGIILLGGVPFGDDGGRLPLRGAAGGDIYCTIIYMNIKNLCKYLRSFPNNTFDLLCVEKGIEPIICCLQTDHTKKLREQMENDETFRRQYNLSRIPNEPSHCETTNPCAENEEQLPKSTPSSR
tara:strand:- start:28 stop:483 length:456 start_codon:yes stop_codon:yes gene_type:complete